MTSRLVILAYILATGVLCPLVASALTAVEADSDLRVTVFGPDWIWQGQNVSVIAVFENASAATRELTVQLEFPLELAGHFAYDGALSQIVQIAPEDSARIAFANIRAETGVARQTYDFQLVATETDGAARFEFSYPLETVRGAAVGDGIWAALLPAILAGSWCFILGFYLMRRSDRGAWKMPSEAVWELESA